MNSRPGRRQVRRLADPIRVSGQPEAHRGREGNQIGGNRKESGCPDARDRAGAPDKMQRAEQRKQVGIARPET